MLNEVLADRFRITGELGAGGMGQVWAAEDTRMRRDVAIKVMHPQYGIYEAKARARFEREVQLAARLNHRNIVTVHDWGEVPVGGRQTPYLVMERVEGVALDDRLAESTPLPWPVAVAWAAQIAQALDAAHRQGVVHRDIKPGNALITPDGTVKVLDFGLAKFLGDTIGARKLTTVGSALGTLEYMSPEQGLGGSGGNAIDHRSDLYSLGCLLYHAVTGEPPFTSTGLAVLRMHMEDTPIAPATRVEGLPAALNDLILSLLAKRPADRPKDAAAVVDVLGTVLVDQAVAFPAEDILALPRPWNADSVTGRMLHKAWELWQETEKRSAATIEAAENQAADLLFSARAEADRLVAEASRKTEESLATARRLADEGFAARLAEANRVGEEIIAKASEEAGSTVEAATAEAARIRREAESRADRVLAVAQEAGEEAQGGVEDDLSSLMSELERWFRQRTKNSSVTEPSTPSRTTELTGATRDTLEIEVKAAELMRMLDIERRDVERNVQMAKAARTGTARVDTNRPVPQTTGAAASYGIELVRRGYDIQQVDDYIATLVAMRDDSRSRIDMIQLIVEELLGLSLQRAGADANDDHLSRRVAQIIGDATRRAASRLPYKADHQDMPQSNPGSYLTPHGFELVRRGYDRVQVDERIDKLMSELHAVKVRVIALADLVEDARRGRIER
ncbi:serine/threonine-protein kinase [Streptomyces justiciae]|uniref:serine/threonine-protein kinase n=1 Tax=Streptomyces justiciae TaxID=2780140 RepID=UPI00188280B5|nr:serine/threonine-protein kinase [Streptomyces justiciae]MBE8476923.1 protein kinase [Streptomyces justiciae]